MFVIFIHVPSTIYVPAVLELCLINQKSNFFTHRPPSCTHSVSSSNVHRFFRSTSQKVNGTVQTHITLSHIQTFFDANIYICIFIYLYIRIWQIYVYLRRRSTSLKSFFTSDIFTQDVLCKLTCQNYSTSKYQNLFLTVSASKKKKKEPFITFLLFWLR